VPGSVNPEWYGRITLCLYTIPIYWELQALSKKINTLWQIKQLTCCIPYSNLCTVAKQKGAVASYFILVSS